MSKITDICNGNLKSKTFFEVIMKEVQQRSVELELTHWEVIGILEDIKMCIRDELND